MTSTEASGVMFAALRPRDAPDEPLPRAIGSPPPRAARVAQLRRTTLLGDNEAERRQAAELGRLCLARGVHVAEAVLLLSRALELGADADDRALRHDLGTALVALGRHEDASDLMSDETASDPQQALINALAAGDAAARHGDAAGAAVIYRELAMMALDDPRALERLATISLWSSGPTPDKLAADAWLGAAARHGGNDAGMCDIARAFEVAPGYRRAAEAYAAVLESQGRFDAADEVWREHGVASGSSGEIAGQRFERARRLGAYPAALSAALDATGANAPSQHDELAELLLDEAASAGLDADADEGRLLAEALSTAMHTNGASGRADALATVALRAHGAARGIILAVASESYAAAGNRARARDAARQACLVAPWLARPFAALLALGGDEEVSATDLENAVALLPARAYHHRLLASHATASGDPAFATAWLRVALSLRPGDSSLRRMFLESSLVVEGPQAVETVASTIALTIDEPYPSHDLDSALCQALDRLTTMAPARAAELGRRMFDRMGPRESLRQAIGRAAIAAGDSALELELAVRQAAAASDGERGALWLAAAEIAVPIDPEAAAAHSSQAAAHRADGERVASVLAAVERQVDQLGEGARSDVQIDLAAARAWIAEHGDDDLLAIQSWRELARLRWDLAGDVHSSEEAFFYACSRDIDHGPSRYASDLCDRGGDELALALLRNRVAIQAETGDTALCGRLLSAGAPIAARLAEEPLAAELAVAAVRFDPSCRDAVAFVEQYALKLNARGVDGASSLLHDTYDALAGGAFGRFGARAAHYRGARLLERIGATEQALAHALAAFEAVPSDGASFRMLLRIAKDAHNLGPPTLAELVAATLDRLPPDERERARPLLQQLNGQGGEGVSPPPDKHRTTQPPLHSNAHSGGTKNDGAEAARLPSSDPRGQSLAVGAESAAEQRGDYVELAALLARREATALPADKKLIRLRRVSVLDRHLGDIDGACRELETLLQDEEDGPALRYLAELQDRTDQHTRAAKLWLRASKVTASLDEKQRDVVRCCRSLLAANQPHRARKLLDAMTRLPVSVELLSVRLAAAHALDDQAEIATVTAALELSERGSRDSSPERIPAHPAAHGLDRSSSSHLAAPAELSRGGRPSGMPRSAGSRSGLPRSAPSPTEAEHALEQIRQDYTRRGAGSPEEAREAVTQLRRITQGVSREQRDLHTFLLVEALEALHQDDAAKHELRSHRDTLGGTPLVSLAMAERLLLRNEPAGAHELMANVVDAELFGMRTRGQVALSAADAAHAAGDLPSARRHLERALREADAREGSRQRQIDWFEDGADQERSLRHLRWHSSPPPPRTSPPTGKLSELRRHLTSGASSPAEDVAPSSGDGRAHPPWTSLPPARVELPDEVDSLERELDDGSYDAGHQLAAIYQKNADRHRPELLLVRVRQARIKRGDVATLVDLCDAARADGNQPYARAVEHALGVFRGDDAPPAPALEELGANPEATTRLLQEPVAGTINDALATLCRAGLQRRELGDYDLDASDRVAPLAADTLGQLVGTLTRLLELEGARTFHQRRTGPLSSRVLLTRPLAAVVNGATDESSPILRYTVGSALIAATPCCALTEALEEPKLNALLQAILAAFGPVRSESLIDRDPEIMRLAQALWHIVQGVEERKFRELAQDPSRVTTAIAKRNAARTRRRAGLFASGDLLTAMAQAAAELDLSVSLPLRGSDGLAQLCAHPDIADLYDLAIQREYAECRWRRAMTVAPPPRKMG